MIYDLFTIYLIIKEPKFKKLILGFGISILLQCNIALFIVIFNHYK